ncbi:Na/Pi cotransporter family protein [bacterium]|nr:Na/Pi cotransporter family protein [bacterium]
MNFSILIQMLIGAIGGLGIFLLGMKYMSEGMQAIAGSRLRRLIRAVTDNRLVAAGVGASITAMIQSSSVTTVMVVGFVNAGLMNLRQAVGVIMGTNIGTTITAWLIAVHIADYGLPILGLAAFFFLFSKNERVRNTAMVFLGLGMVFFGLELMKTGLKPLRTMPEVHAALSSFQPDTIWGLLKCVFIGGLVTAVIQSSSATVAITITLATTGTLSYETAIALVLGENIGTTVTAALASLGASTNAKRTALAHFMFNITGVLIMIPLFYQYLWLLGKISPDTLPIATRIATAHSFFNIFVVVLLLPMINPFAKLVGRLMPDSKKKEQTHLTYLDVRLLDSAAIAIQQSRSEVQRMGVEINKMLKDLREAIEDPAMDKKREDRIFHKENNIDEIQREVVEFISKIMSGSLAHQITDEARKQLRIADEYESVSDYIAGILKLICKLKQNESKLSDEGQKELIELHNLSTTFFESVAKAYENKDIDIFVKVQSECSSLIHSIKRNRTQHLERLENHVVTPMVSLIYMDLLNAYRRLADHTYNVAEVLVGEK